MADAPLLTGAVRPLDRAEAAGDGLADPEAVRDLKIDRETADEADQRHAFQRHGQRSKSSRVGAKVRLDPQAERFSQREAVADQDGFEDSSTIVVGSRLDEAAVVELVKREPGGGEVLMDRAVGLAERLRTSTELGVQDRQIFSAESCVIGLHPTALDDLATFGDTDDVRRLVQHLELNARVIVAKRSILAMVVDESFVLVNLAEEAAKPSGFFRPQ